MRKTLPHHRLRLAGNTIIEVLIATLLVGTVLTALALLMSMNVKNTAEADYREQAARFAQEGVDIVRANKSAQNWSAFIAGSPPGGLSNCAATETRYNMTFTRTCTLGTDPDDSSNTNRKQLKVTVSWNSGTNTLDVYQKIYNY